MFLMPGFLFFCLLEVIGLSGIKGKKAIYF